MLTPLVASPRSWAASPASATCYQQELSSWDVVQQLEASSAAVVVITCPTVQARVPYHVLRAGMELGEAMLWARGPPEPPATCSQNTQRVSQVGDGPFGRCDAKQWEVSVERQLHGL